MATKTTNNSTKVVGKILSVVHKLIEYFGRWFYLLTTYYTGRPEPLPPADNPIILMKSLTALSIMIRLKKLSSESVVKAYIDRIRKIQPVLNCLAEDRFEEALEEAREYDRILNSSNAPSIEELEKEKPFFGVPFTTKDCIAIKGMKQTAGLVLRKDTRAEEDAEVIRLLRKAGAIPLATTNVSELAMWWETSNYLYGTTRNPYNTCHIVGGSSGGEGCLQAAAGAPFGIGSDIGGSIRMPCFFNGIFGHKPSKGIVSNHGQYPCPHCEEQYKLLAIGPMCRYAGDLKPILKIIAGENASKLNLDEKVDISKLKFYYMEDDGGQYLVSPVSKDIKEAMNKVIWYLTWNHKVKVEKVQIKKMKKSLALWLANMTSPEGKDFAYELSNRKKRINIFWEFIKWATGTGEHTLIALITAAFEAFGIKYNSEERSKLLQETRDLNEEFRDMLGKNGVFLYPTHPTPAPLHHEPLLKAFNFSYTAIINCLGLPATACPLGFSNGLPIGIQVVAGLYQDHLTLAVAEELERDFGGWVMPNTKTEQPGE
ncbi:fatty-acid amide hydrolase 2 [Chelonus insularis]|uniref:fatty-acid amide hydrolase 2 n=1 Tax=Chelonus insularis TaxID=460826 RepID=UPI00158C3BFE|nr:fatty-acid amide hydrolase 2 [Chelonus insularis]